jgi:hypothetical protein
MASELMGLAVHTPAAEVWALMAAVAWPMVGDSAMAQAAAGMEVLIVVQEEVMAAVLAVMAVLMARRDMGAAVGAVIRDMEVARWGQVMGEGPWQDMVEVMAPMGQVMGAWAVMETVMRVEIMAVGRAMAAGMDLDPAGVAMEAPRGLRPVGRWEGGVREQGTAGTILTGVVSKQSGTHNLGRMIDRLKEAARLMVGRLGSQRTNGDQTFWREPSNNVLC